VRAGSQRRRAWAGVGRGACVWACVHMCSHVWGGMGKARVVADAAGVGGSGRGAHVCTSVGMCWHVLTRVAGVGRCGQEADPVGVGGDGQGRTCVRKSGHVFTCAHTRGMCGEVWACERVVAEVAREGGGGQAAHVCTGVGMEPSHALTRVAGVAREPWAGAGGVSEEVSVGRGAHVCTGLGMCSHVLTHLGV
jgi:hypothetical protein